MKLGEPYTNLKKVYSISLLYFDITEDGDDYICHGKTEFTGLHTHHPVTLKKSLVGDQVRIGETNIFPEYYLIPLKRFADVVRDDLNQWVYAFKNNEVPDEFTAPGIEALKEYFVLATPDIQTEIGPTGTKLTGTVTVPEARIRPRNIPAGAVSPSPNVVTVSEIQEEQSHYATSMDLRLVLGDKEKFDYLRMDEQERRRFDKHIDYVRSEWGVIKNAKREAEEARQEGIKEKLAKGLAKGREEERQRHEKDRKTLVKSLL